MPKILWVALPLLLAAALLVGQCLRGRAPSRTAINIGSSVLLLAYVATTAGLGIFWVANQQLPVFDWHYLFGYGTALLVSLHLAFNFPLVWRFFTRRPERGREVSQTPAAAAVAATRRSLLGAFGVLAATGAAFVLGLRHGRSELKVEPSPVGTTSSRAGATPALSGSVSEAAALALVERFHAFSAHTRAGVLTRAPSGGWGEPPPPFKRHTGAALIRLPAPGAARAGRFDLASLAALLWHTAGVTETRGGLSLRASPSSGALFATELYMLARSLPGLGPGVLHYDPQSHALERLGAASLDALPGDAIDGGAAHEAPAFVIATAVFQRSGHKYRDRTYRYVLADLGHALENLRVAAGVLGMPARFVAAFDEARLARALGVDESLEGVLAVVALGGSAGTGAAPPARPMSVASPLPMAWPSPAAPSALTAETPAARWQVAALPTAGATASTLPSEAPGVTAAVHAATSLRAAAPAPAMSAPGAAAMPGASPVTPETLVALPAAEPVTPDWLHVIATRRSVRRYSAVPLSLTALAAVLSRMATSPGPLLSPAVRIDIVVHAVEGLEPGVYRYQPGGHALLRRRAQPAAGRAATRAAALDQDVIGDAAAVLVLAIDRASFAADPLGAARGYRHAFLETGLVGERAYLEAGARGLGACAVGAFYDDEADALVGVDPAREWVVHFAALGVKG